MHSLQIPLSSLAQAIRRVSIHCCMKDQSRLNCSLSTHAASQAAGILSQDIGAAQLPSPIRIPHLDPHPPEW